MQILDPALLPAGECGAPYDISMNATDSVLADAEPAAARGGVLLRNAPRIGAAHARLTRLIGQGLQLPLPLPGAQLTLRLDQGGGLPWSEVLSLSGPMGVFEIAQGARLLNALTGIDPAALDTDDGVYPDWFVAALSGRLMGTPFQGVNSISRVDRVTHAVAAGGAASTLQLSIFQQGHEVAMPLRTASATWLQLLAGVRRWPLRLPLAPYLGLTSVDSICVGRHSLPGSVLRKLEAGDIVLPQQLYFSTDGSGTARVAGRPWQVRYQAPCNLHIIAQENRLDTEDALEQHGDMAAAAAAANAGSPPASSDPAPVPSQAAPSGPGPDSEPDSATAALLDEVHMTLSFELGRVSLPLAAIRSLGPETVLTLQGGANAITILCSGRTVGRGEAVDVEGVLGIRITQWGGAC